MVIVAALSHIQLPCLIAGVVDAINGVTKTKLTAATSRLSLDPDDAPENTHSTVPSRDSIRLFFLIAALNDLPVLSADMKNAHLSAPIKEKCCVVANEELALNSDWNGKPCKVARALCGPPVAGASFRSYLAKHLTKLGCIPCKADRDAHPRPFVRDGEKLHQMAVCHVDDVLACGVRPKDQMDEIERKFKLKKGSVQEPDTHLGANVEKVNINDNDGSPKVCWGISPTACAAKAIAETERVVGTGKCGHMHLPKKSVSTPLATGCRPECDESRELNDEEQNYYQSLVGILRWLAELGRLDVLHPVSLMSRCLAQARIGHMNQVLRTFAHLKGCGKSKIVMDPSRPVVDESRFQKCDWSEHHPDAKELTDPPDEPEPRGRPVKASCFVDADHAGCRITRRSHTGTLIFCNGSPILWFSERQTTVESSTFGGEIVAMRIAVEMIEGLRHKLGMMGAPVDGPADVHCDNESVVKNTSRPESPLKKKHQAVSWHGICEACAGSVLRTAKEDTKTNVSDLFTKSLDAGRLKELSSRCMWTDCVKRNKEITNNQWGC